MDNRDDATNPPSLFLHLMEAPRTLWELGAHFAAAPLTRLAPRGDGHPVLVLPGLAADDDSTMLLRRFLREIGYDPHPWKLGRNHGREHDRQLPLEIAERVRQIHRATGRRVSLVGWSLGGVYARDVAKIAPELVRLVITMGSPIGGRQRANNAWRLFEALSGTEIADTVVDPRRSAAPPVPTTSIFSKTDGIVAWQYSLEQPGDEVENVEVKGSHCGLGHNPLVFLVIADRLAQPEGEWAPFDRGGIRGLLFRRPGSDSAIFGMI